jgi:hypothetical protein
MVKVKKAYTAHPNHVTFQAAGERSGQPLKDGASVGQKLMIW